MNTQFGTGLLYAIPNAGNLAANPTPQRIGIMQEASVEFKGDLKKLYGKGQFAAVTARGKIEVSGKFKFATLDPNALNQLYFGQVATTGINRLAIDESHAPGATVAVTGLSGFVKDYGVVNGDTGAIMTYIAGGTHSSLSAGQYTQSAGTYVFADAETATKVLINYIATDTAGTTIALKNQLLGSAPEFRALLWNVFRGKAFGLELNSCKIGMISIPTKQDDFWIVDASFEASVDATDSLGSLFADNF